MNISLSGFSLMSSLRLSRWSTVGVLLTAATVPSLVSAQEAAASTAAAVPVRDVSAVIARSAQPFTSVNMVRGLPDGSVFVNDVQRRQLLRLDASLSNVVVVADTAPGALMPYGQRPLGLMPYLGDSTIVVDPSTTSLVVLNPDGRTARVMASPRTNDINLLANMNLGTHAFDAKGRMYYRQFGGGPGGGMGAMFGNGMDRGRGGAPGGNNNNNNNRPNQNNRGGGGGGDFGGPPGGGGFGGGQGGQGGQPFGGPGGRGFNPNNQPDSVPIVRVDFDTRKADTVTFLKVPKNETQMTRGDDGTTRVTVKINPLPQADDWALLADGTVAVMRVLDYHVDYYRPDGSHVASEKLPFDWKRITDDEKVKLVDSLKVLAEAAMGRQSANPNSTFRMTMEPIAADRLPDYYPPIRQGSSIADREGNLWVVPTTSNLSAQLAQQFMGPGGGMRGAMPGQAGARPGAAGAAAGGAGRDSTRQGPPPAAAMAMMAGMMNQPPLVYDVVNAEGKLQYRVKLPPGRQIAGFGANGLIYLQAREQGRIFLETVKLN